MLLRYSLRTQEPNARRDDDLGLDLPLTMVQEHVYRESYGKPLAVGQFDLMHCSQILFLNKNDLFEKKVSTVPGDLSFLIDHLRELPEDARKFIIWASFFGPM